MTHTKKDMEKNGASPAKRLEVGRVYILSPMMHTGQDHLACTDDLSSESSGHLVEPLRHAMSSSKSYCYMVDFLPFRCDHCTCILGQPGVTRGDGDASHMF